MIIVRLKGGLGNQMFEYALARRISIEKNIELKIDTSFLEAEAKDYTKRGLELFKFNINAEIATNKEIKSILMQGWKNIFYPVWIKDRGIDKFFKKKLGSNDLYLDGYWQSYFYFESIIDIIGNDFTVKQPLKGDYFEYITNQINNTNSVSLHFRRGEYVDNPKVNSHHGICPIEYYHNSIDYIAKTVVNPHLFVFSDDIEWVKANFKSILPITFIDYSDNDLLSDFRLMSMCKHNIIANSSYSWWAAWLNKNKNKIIVAPKRWYINERSQKKSQSMIPPEWIRV